MRSAVKPPVAWRRGVASTHLTPALPLGPSVDGPGGTGYRERSEGNESLVCADAAADPTREDYVDAHPASPVLVVEVAESSLARDRERKGNLYARAGIADYWIVNLLDGVLEVHRDPARIAARRWRYTTVGVMKPHEVVRPLASPRARLRVCDLLV
jgi:Uma2 family endonuclease